MDKLISLQAALDALGEEPYVWEEDDDYARGMRFQWKNDHDAIEALPSAQPERLTDDDFETIRIHLNAYKEKLCNQHRWEEAEEYQRIIDRFMAFASAQPEQRWIPVSERLPDEYGEYLVTKRTIGWNCEEYNSIDIAYFDNDGFHKAYKVLAWMPMPEPYKEDPCNGCDYLGESCVGEGCGKLTERRDGEADG